jgi:ABC-type multidrug transport system fused ATPase/permease subunit
LKKFIAQLFKILNPKEQTRLFIMAGLDLLMGVADVAFLVVLLFIINVYTGSRPSSSNIIYYRSAVMLNPVKVTGIFLLLFCLKNLIGVWISKKQNEFVYGISSRLSEKNIISYLKGNYIDFVNVDSSRRIRQISQEPIEFSTYILTNFQQVIAQGILIVFSVAAILLYHPVLFVLLLILLVPPVVLLGWLVKQQLRKVRGEVKTNSTKVIQHLQEALGGYVESNIYGRHDFFAGRYQQYQQQMNTNIARQQTLQGISSRFFEVFALLGFFILISINKWYAGSGVIDLLTIGVFMAAAYKIIPGMVKILNSAGQIKTYSFIMDDLAETGATKQETNFKMPPVVIQRIAFNDVAFSYNKGVILDGVSFEISRGDMAGISGISGRGKTTIINILLGFLQQDQGKVSINDNIANASDRKAIWPRVAYVKQQSFFINDTVLKNITLSDGDYNQKQLARAINLSGLNAFLKDYPEGVDKQVSEHGKNISGGQKQRIALARALYRDFDLLILDEPFSEMDHDAEQEVLQNMKSLSRDGKIILLITHNRASLNYCNKIISPYAVA